MPKDGERVKQGGKVPCFSKHRAPSARRGFAGSGGGLAASRVSCTCAAVRPASRMRASRRCAAKHGKRGDRDGSVRHYRVAGKGAGKALVKSRRCSSRRASPSFDEGFCLRGRLRGAPQFTAHAVRPCAGVGGPSPRRSSKAFGAPPTTSAWTPPHGAVNWGAYPRALPEDKHHLIEEGLALLGRTTVLDFTNAFRALFAATIMPNAPVSITPLSVLGGSALDASHP